MGNEFRRVIATTGGDVRARLEQLGQSAILIFREDVVLARAPADADTDECVLGAGAIAVPRRDPDDARRRVYAVYPYGVFEALRGCLHAKEGYGSATNGELRTVRVSQQTAADVVRFLARWSSLTPAQRVRVDDLTARLVATSERWRNVFKRKAADYFDESIYAMDALGRKNPAATSAKLAAARRQLTFRMGEIGAIVPWLGHREAALYMEVERIHGILITAWESLGKIAAVLADGTVTVAARMAAVRELRAIATELASVHVEPFITNFGEASRELESAARHLIRGRRTAARELVGVARDGLRFKFAQFELEELLRHFVFALEPVNQLTDTEVAAVHRRVRSFHERLARLHVQGLRHDPYDEVEHAISTALAHFDTAAPVRVYLVKLALKAASHAM